MKRRDEFLLNPISYGDVPHVLLVGDGINRCFEEEEAPDPRYDRGAGNWEKVIIDEALENLPRLYRDEVKKLSPLNRIVVATNDGVHESMKRIFERLDRKPHSPAQDAFLKDAANGGFDAILTTNYTLEFEKAFGWTRKDISRRLTTAGEDHKNLSKEEKLRLHRYTLLPTETQPSLWHIHGIGTNIDSMIMSHYYYGKLMALFPKYLHRMKTRYMSSVRAEKSYQPESWVDYFMLGNVHMLGFGFDEAEFDLWWLAACKKREFLSDERFDSGDTYYYQKSKLSNEKAAFMAAYKIRPAEIEYVPETGSYEEYYTAALKHITESIK